MVKVLLENGAYPDYRWGMGGIALQQAASLGETAIAQLFLDACANVNPEEPVPKYRYVSKTYCRLWERLQRVASWISYIYCCGAGQT